MRGLLIDLNAPIKQLLKAARYISFECFCLVLQFGTLPGAGSSAQRCQEYPCVFVALHGFAHANFYGDTQSKYMLCLFILYFAVK